jgi:hypothetical protein
VFIAIVNTSPATLLGGGTWAAFATGRMLIGLDAGAAGWDTVEETGGAVTHSHAFTQPGAHTMGAIAASASTAKIGTSTSTASASGHTHAAPTITAHSGGAVTDGSTMPPYIAVYMWKRTA